MGGVREATLTSRVRHEILIQVKKVIIIYDKKEIKVDSKNSV